MRSIAIATAIIIASSASAEVSVERGEYIVRGPGACGNCHTPFGPAGPDPNNELGGRLVESNDLFTAMAPNITPGGRIADWSDEELGKAIREGIRPDGSVIGPPMPFTFYRDISDDDLASIVAFLRTLPASDNDPGASEYKMQLPPAYGPPVLTVPAIPAGVTVEYGEYLAGPIAHCMECHTTFGPAGPMVASHLGAGGFEFHGPWGTSVAANLTPHEDGIAKWSDDELVQMITTGTRPDGSRMFPPMPYPNFAATSADDIAAIVLYLRSLPPLPSPQ